MALHATGKSNPAHRPGPSRWRPGLGQSERTIAAELRDLARQVDRLLPLLWAPEQFHIQKSEVSYALRRLARRTA
jgi:hypothetical protein